MIYSKKANFPYPVLANNSCGYKGAEFEFDVILKENASSYIFEVEYKISSGFIRGLLNSRKALLLMVIKSKDNQFHVLSSQDRPIVEIPRSRLTLSSKTTLQLMIQAAEPIGFRDNCDLDRFYDGLKEEILIDEGMALGFSNLVIFNGVQKKPFDLFEKKVNEDIQSDIEIQLGQETILIVYKNEEMQFRGFPEGDALNYPYIYIGLQKALINFLFHYTENVEEGVELSDIGEPISVLDGKLYNLMETKGIIELSLDNMDQVIYLISDNLLSKYVNAVRGMRNGN